ncbi:M56 family metallopeptidase [Paenibacillus herberti]|uniref:Peptidase M56 domain-containing protein n=1 Tax=Paenibacillus herberti TaxID=1619309 RepID=A0A229P574_9BACL|nr:M56 family metallopeptidase [Paenibacillus herberti]OXM17065.1 hypothetical protein CGZ75_10685 [Paenibacillus herberti]
MSDQKATYSEPSSPPWLLSTQTGRFLLIVWVLGAVGFSTWQIYCYIKFAKNVRSTWLPVPKENEAVHLLNELKQNLSIPDKVQIAYSNGISSPILMGIRSPAILLPAAHCLQANLKLVIHHELVHLKQKDLWVKLLVLVVSAVHWFNQWKTINEEAWHDDECKKGKEEVSANCHTDHYGW